MIEILVILAALLHLAWNRLFHTKLTEAADLSRGLLAACAALGLILIAVNPAAFSLPLLSWICAASSGVLHAVYFIFLLRLYRSAEFALVYPLARAWSVCVAAFLGSLILQEVISEAALLGICFIVASSWALVPLSEKHISSFVAKKIAGCVGIGSLVAFVGLIDKVGITNSSPLGYCFVIFAVCALGLGAYGSTQSSRKSGFGASPFSFFEYLALGFGIVLAYGLILQALARGPLHEIAALREISLVLTLLAGIFLDGERMQLRKALSLGALIVGVIFVDLAA